MLSSNASKQVHGDSPVIKYLIRQCPNCKNTIKIKSVNGNIVEIEGAYKCRIFAEFRRPWTFTLQDSKKQVICTGMKNGFGCDHFLRVTFFKEIIL